MGILRKLGWTLAAGLLALGTGAAQAGGGGGGGGHCAGFADSGAILMRDNCFEGVAQFAPAGSTLTVYNEGGLPHSLTDVSGDFDTGTLQPGEEAVFTVGDAGVIRYYCRLHGTAQGDGMAGVIIVGEAAGGATRSATPSWAPILGWLGGGLGGAVLALLVVRFRPR